MVYTERYESSSELLERVLSPMVEDNNHNARTVHRNDEHWDFGVGFEGAINLAKYGWPEGREIIRGFTETLTTTLTGMINIPEVRYDVTGQNLDIGKFLVGEPEDFMSIVDSAVEIDANPARIIRVVVNVFTSFSINSAAVMMKGAACAALCDMLERHNIRCQVDAVLSIGGGEFYATIKRPEWPMNLDDVAFYLAHPASCRRVFFNLLDHVEDAQVRKQVGAFNFYGRKKAAEDKGDIYVDGLESRIDISKEKAIKWVVEQLESQGIEVEHE